MSTASPLVSVIMPVFNGATFLKDAVDSILGQTLTDFEFIIIDDGSTDGSVDVILSYSDPRIKFYPNGRNLGLVSSLNIGLSKANGKFIARMDQDDISLPNRLQAQYDFMSLNPSYILCGTSVEYMGSRPKRSLSLTDAEIKVELIFGCPFVHPTVMIRREALLKSNLKYDEKYKHAEDYGLWMELVPLGKMANLSMTGLKYRLHEHQYSVTFKQAMLESCARIRINYLQYLGVHLAGTDLQVFKIITDREIRYSVTSSIAEIGAFLYRFPFYFSQGKLSDKVLHSFTSSKWRIILSNRQKLGFSSYAIYFKSALAWRRFEPKIHLWFIKMDCILFFKYLKSHS